MLSQIVKVVGVAIQTLINIVCSSIMSRRNTCYGHEVTVMNLINIHGVCCTLINSESVLIMMIIIDTGM